MHDYQVDEHNVSRIPLVKIKFKQRYIELFTVIFITGDILQQLNDFLAFT